MKSGIGKIIFTTLVLLGLIFICSFTADGKAAWQLIGGPFFAVLRVVALFVMAGLCIFLGSWLSEMFDKFQETTDFMVGVPALIISALVAGFLAEVICTFMYPGITDYPGLNYVVWGVGTFLVFVAAFPS